MTKPNKHFCEKTPMMASMEFNKKRVRSPGFELTLMERKKEGKLTPKSYMIKIGINYCPFCGLKLAEEHPGDCICLDCGSDRMITGR